MKRVTLIISFILIACSSYSQRIEDLKHSLDSLKRLKDLYEVKMLEIDKEYSRVEKVLSQKQFDETIGASYICTSGTNIYRSSKGADMITHIYENNKVKVIGQDNENYKVVFKNDTGWIIKIALISEIENQKRMEEKEAREAANLKRYEADKQVREKLEKDYADNRLAKLNKLYSPAIVEKILAEEIWLGMTDGMARESWGSPININRSVGSWGIHEQWIYKHTNLYFENGKLTSWQDSK